MVTVPHRLLDAAGVRVVTHAPGLTILRKELREPLHERPSYVARHALSLVTSGTQVVYDRHAARVRIGAGEVGLMRRGLYSITDVLPGAEAPFRTTVVFFDDAALDRALAALPGAAGHAGDAGAVEGVGLRRFGSTPAAAEWARYVADVGVRLDAAAPEWYADRLADLFGLLHAAHGAPLLDALRRLRRVPRRPLREFMRAHFDKPLAVEDYAYLTGRSLRSFRRDFKARFGLPPKRWLVEQRLGRARELLRREGLPVQDLAAAVGYTSTSHFIALYRRAYGRTPGAEVRAGL